MKQLTIENIQVGQSVLVKSNVSKPPRHHSRKLREWELSNYTGEIMEVDKTCNRVRVKDTERSNAVIEFNFWIYLESAKQSIWLRENHI